jgi:hypothetical protein
LLRFIGALLRLYTYVFEAALCLFALAFSAVLLASPHEQIRMGWLPWSGEALGAAMAVFGLLGMLVLILAANGRTRLPLTMFALAGLAIVARGMFFSPWRFDGAVQARNGILFVLALFAAFLGSFPARRGRGSEFRGTRSR